MYPRCIGCGEQMSSGDKLCKFCRKDHPIEYRPYDTYADEYGYDRKYDYYDADPYPPYKDPHQGKLVEDYRDLIRELEAEVSFLQSKLKQASADIEHVRASGRADERRSVLAALDAVFKLINEWDMQDTIFGEKLLDLIQNWEY